MQPRVVGGRQRRSHVRDHALRRDWRSFSNLGRPTTSPSASAAWGRRLWCRGIMRTQGSSANKAWPCSRDGRKAGGWLMPLHPGVDGVRPRRHAISPGIFRRVSDIVSGHRGEITDHSVSDRPGRGGRSRGTRGTGGSTRKCERSASPGYRKLSTAGCPTAL